MIVKSKNLDYSTTTPKATLAFFDAVALIVGNEIKKGVVEFQNFLSPKNGR